MTITVMIGFLLRFTKDIGLTLMTNMYIFANECIH